MDLGQSRVTGPPPLGAGTFPRCPGIPRSVGPPALFQSISLSHNVNRSVPGKGPVLCQFRANLPWNLQPGKACAPPAQGLVCGKGSPGPHSCFSADGLRRPLHAALPLHRHLHNPDLHAFGHPFPTATTTWPPYPQPLPNSHPFSRPGAAVPPRVKSVLARALPVSKNHESPLSGHVVVTAARPRLVGAGVPWTLSPGQEKHMRVSGTGDGLSSHPSPEGRAQPQAWRA